MLPSITKTAASAGPEMLSRKYGNEIEDYKDKGYNASVGVLEFGDKLRELNSITSVEKNYEHFLKDFFDCKESNIFLFNEDRTALKPVSVNVSLRGRYFINNLLTAGTLNEILETGKHKIILDSFVKNIDGSKSYYLIIPFLNVSKFSGVLSLQMPNSLNDNSIEIPLIKISLEMYLNKLEIIEKKEELKSAYDELQVYQSKLSNDYKLSAIGELTSGIVEDVLSPLQVITTSTEFLKHENDSTDDKVLDTINYQVQKVKNVINRLVKFAGTGDVKNKFYPCNINRIISEFYGIFNSSLKSNNYECVLDLGNDIPSVLTHPNYINQILTNIVLLIKAGENTAGGILIQTKCIKNSVAVKFLLTDYFDSLNDDTLKNGHDINLKIINNLMLRHQGTITFDSDKNRGTMITLSFPLIRKVVG